ncbi:MAG: ABC transporter ATP-binding protein [Erysipelotrichaceae bacterium]|nr:ABC transporter ATP-binding protein/permease [Solobacterium sp.]MDD7776339.1 ABC transporter ATP-binding protein [Solobacterium sp.]MDY2953279.1 ABC transporter ATP-binding protein [Erysipelotrichaceae bacterium]MDY5402375.1 ABC transporter ATP-binding protein [Erysipelotrichaceae bacterium]
MNRFKLLIKDYKKESILAPLFKLLESLFDLFVPLVIAGIINKGINNNDFHYVLKMFMLLILLVIIGLACSIVAQYFAAKASVGFTTKLRQMLFEHIQSFSYQNLDEIGQDTLITRLTSDTNQIQNGLNLALRLLLRSPFIVFGAMVMAFTINVKCALIFAVVIPLLCLVVFLIMIKSIPLFKEVQVALDGLLSKTRENLSGIRVIRAFRIEDKEFNEFKEKNDLLTRRNQRVGFLSALTNPLTYILINMATVVLIYTGTIEVRMYGLAQGDVVALYNYMAQIVVELVKMANLIITIDKSLACFSRVEKILDIEPDMKYVDGISGKVNNHILTFDNVSFKYPNSKEACLENISFSINKGETLGIIGPTGCGKTSLVNLIYRAYDPSVGAVYLDGVDIKSYSKDELVNKVSVVPQKATLFKESIKDNLRMADPNVSEEKMWEALDIAQAKEIVLNKEGQLDHMVEQGGKNLSGGQRQRLSIARALCKDFDILILDDSFSALDYQTEAKLRMALNTLNKTIVNVSQRASSIKNADKILVLDDGKLVGFGSHDDLMKSCELYKEIYYSQYPFEKEADHE